MPLGLFLRRPVLVVELGPVLPPLPSSCANCGADAGHSVKEASKEHTLLVPYCARCFQSLGREGTRQFAATLSSVLVALTLLLTLPRLWPTAGVVSYVAAVAVGAALPLLIGLLLRRTLESGQSAVGRAVWWTSPHTLVCTSETWGQQLLVGTDAKASPARASEPWVWSRLMGVTLGVALAPVMYTFQHPETVVLNLSETPFEVVLDGKSLTRVEVTSLESSSAGVRLRIASGRHSVVLRGLDGHELLKEELVLTAGRTHLYAPLSPGYCFWLEADAYGKAKPQERYRPLPQEQRFWTLPVDVDTWFAQNPEPVRDERSSGGTLIALRHARCDQAPGGS
jgi:hypothetical protein